MASTNLLKERFCVKANETSKGLIRHQLLARFDNSHGGISVCSIYRVPSNKGLAFSNAKMPIASSTAGKPMAQIDTWVFRALLFDNSRHHHFFCIHVFAQGAIFVKMHQKLERMDSTPFVGLIGHISRRHFCLKHLLGALNSLQTQKVKGSNRHLSVPSAAVQHLLISSLDLFVQKDELLSKHTNRFKSWIQHPQLARFDNSHGGISDWTIYCVSLRASPFQTQRGQWFESTPEWSERLGSIIQCEHRVQGRQCEHWVQECCQQTPVSVLSCSQMAAQP